MNRISQGLTGWMAPPLSAISVCLALTGTAQAADAPAARTAAAAASHGAGHGAAAHAGRVYVTVAGDTADRVVKKAMADIPLKDEILRDALIQANPKVFTAGAKTRLRPGTQLALPDPHPMLRQILMPLLEPKEAGAYFPPPPVSVEERRRWVRYP
jgi:Tfp pilus assembly protein FimV